MQLSLSTRVAEGFLSKEVPTMTLDELCRTAVDAGYDAICMRASQVGVQSSPDVVQQARRTLDVHGLTVTMVTGDFDIVYNNDRGPGSLRNVTPYLDLAEAFGAPLLRVCIKTEEDLKFAQVAADEAAERGLKLAHQCHADSLFETVDEIEASLQKIDRDNFGLIFEAGNLDECGQPYGPEVIKRLAPWIFNVYLQNQRCNPDGAVTLKTRCRGPVSLDILPVQQPGGIDFAAVFDGLHTVDYDGVVTVHQSAPADGSSSSAAAREAAEFLRTLW
jgi:sugar phosphate isomerase/epimerase